MQHNKQKTLGAAMLCLAMALPFGGIAQDETRVITCGTLNLRRQADINSPVLGKYGWGTSVNVLGVAGDWSSVEVNGQRGYMYSRYLGKEGDTAYTAYVNTRTRGLNLRTAPDGAIVTSFPRGTAVTVLSSEGGWSKVKAGDTVGYMADRWLSLAKPSSSSAVPVSGTAVVSNPRDTQVLFLRSKADIASEALGYYRNGKAVTLLSRHGNWYKVRVDGMTGYMLGKYLTVSTPSSASVVNPNGGSYVNFRKAGSLSAPVLSRVPVGTKIAVLDRTTDWTLTEIDGVRGYISTWFLTF